MAVVLFYCGGCAFFVRLVVVADNREVVDGWKKSERCEKAGESSSRKRVSSAGENKAPGFFLLAERTWEHNLMTSTRYGLYVHRSERERERGRERGFIGETVVCDMSSLDCRNGERCSGILVVNTGIKPVSGRQEWLRGVFFIRVFVLFSSR
uniref:Secreted protein n=1 Tax=Peronospora matthiolae TaxID=2874970 RepID=A0AAV1UQC8_9STRA